LAQGSIPVLLFIRFSAPPSIPGGSNIQISIVPYPPSKMRWRKIYAIVLGALLPHVASNDAQLEDAMAKFDDDMAGEEGVMLFQAAAEVLRRADTEVSDQQAVPARRSRDALVEDMCEEFSSSCQAKSEGGNAAVNAADAPLIIKADDSDVLDLTFVNAELALPADGNVDKNATAQAISWWLRLTLQALVVLILIDGIRRCGHDAADAPVCRGQSRDLDPVRQEDKNLKQHGQDFFRAALDGDFDRCEALLSDERIAAAIVSAEDVWGCTALHIAASREGAKSFGLTSALLQKGAKVDARDTVDETPLLSAARTGNVEVCNLLLAYGAGIDSTNMQEQSALFIAALEGQQETCKFLLKRGAAAPTLSRDELPILLQDLLAEEARYVPAADDDGEDL